MKTTRLGVLAAAVALVATLGCGDGTQHGRFVARGSGSHALADVTGTFTIVFGDTNPAPPKSEGNLPLLYVLTLAPGVTSNGNGGKFNSGSTVTTLTDTWQTPQGDISFELRWDRETDIVTTAGQTFQRNKGNAFVLVRNPAGAIEVTQIGPIEAGVEASAAFPKVQALLPADSPAKSISLMH